MPDLLLFRGHTPHDAASGPWGLSRSFPPRSRSASDRVLVEAGVAADRSDARRSGQSLLGLTLVRARELLSG